MRCKTVLFAWSIAVLAAGVAHAQQSVYFRHDQGVADDDTLALPDELDPARALWKQPLPPGASTPTIVGERVYLTGNDGDELITLCLDRTSGKELWRQSIRVEKLEMISSHDFGQRIAATPVIFQGRIYLRTLDALYCFARP